MSQLTSRGYLPITPCKPKPKDLFALYEYVCPRLLQQEERAILPHEELLETINLGMEEDRKEVKVGANLEPNVKEHLVQLLNEYVEIFAWSYEDMPGLHTDIVVHRLPTREYCPPIK